MNKLPIKRRAERAFATDYLPQHLAIQGLTIYEGHEAADQIALPALIVYAEDSQQFGDMPMETGVRTVRIRFGWQVDATASARALLDEWKEQLECSVLNQEKVRETLNKPETGIDRRKVGKIHFHATMIAGDPSDRQETDWIEQQVYDVVVEDMPS